ncbi:MAG: transposase [Candidatus Dactylopiibacterium carminicum]|uniref:Transposase n=1 Tax=Candidatus Dactylopiibacterium carminicum TaxID=857335 RepID=A0A272EQJ8_9RHOO|nr:transposase [Candidatus Dactylopiibacterium carminicum]KAF7598608.1 transposase [Candidatus Dactylopiibacterium carminicum]PAS92361.1 MAG: transposase [Candidatus Dactylopiibacterium carminicum]PAS95807.1 MAG: transposase [Candidatus Dactylopiibacterium carminicum]PAS98374.1 MAG: transposase [Candidatus Dactylopiibacterium carminicum]
MSRLPRLHIPGMPQLLTQRGNNRALVFLDDQDQQQYLSHLRDALRETGVQLHAWVLMPEHVHLLVTPPAPEAIGGLMQRLGRRYVRWFNDRHRRTGTLWEGRYRAAVLEPGEWLLAVSSYVELNPLRAGLAATAEHYPWSSCRHHLGLTRDPLITDHAGYWALGNTPFERQASYRRLLEQGLGDERLARIRYAAHRGWLLGDLVPAVDVQPNRRVAPLPKGRPRLHKS